MRLIVTRLRLVKAAQQCKDIIFDYNKYFKNLTSERIDMIIHDEMRSRIVDSASSRLGQDFSDKTPEEIDMIIHDEMRFCIVVVASSRLSQDFSDKNPKEMDLIIHDEMRSCTVVASSSRLGQDLSDKTPEELEVIIHDEMRFRIVVAASNRLGQDLSDKTPEELEMIIHDKMRFRIVAAGSNRLGQDLLGKTPKEIDVIIVNAMRFRIVVASSSRLGQDLAGKTSAKVTLIISNRMRGRQSQMDQVKNSRVQGTSRLQAMEGIGQASLNLHPVSADDNRPRNQPVTTDPTGLEAAAADLAARWTTFHETTESKVAAAGPHRQKKGLRKGYDVLKKQMKEFEGALGYNHQVAMTENNASNWDKYANELKKRTPGPHKQTPVYKGVSAD